MRSILICLLLTTAAAPLMSPKGGPLPGKNPGTLPVPRITVTSALAEDSVRKHSQVYFTGTIVNEGTVSVTGVSVAAAPPDTIRFIQRLPVSGRESCEGPTVQSMLSGELPAGGRQSFCGILEATESHPKRRVTLVVQYANGPNTYTTTSSPGWLNVQNWWEYWGAKGYNVLKDFAFPIFLAGFGLILKRITDKRELRAETWKQMLSQSHELAGKYYIPQAGAALGMSVEWKRYAGKPAERAEAARQMFFYILNFGRLMRDMRYAIGGFYFKDRIGEQIAGRCWKEMRDTYFPTTDEQQRLNYFGALRLVEDKQDVDVLLEKLDTAGPASPLRKTWEVFEDLTVNSDRMENMMAYFELFRAIVVYESNRVYAHWYRLPETLQLTDDQRTRVDDLFHADMDKKQAKRYIKVSAKGQ